jgi:hypothetical protein
MSIVQRACNPFESFDYEKTASTLNTMKRLGYPLYSLRSSPKSVVPEKESVRMETNERGFGR